VNNQSSPSSTTFANDLTGKTVGRFQVEMRLGAGGMGEVYRARDTKLRRVVALKRVAAHLLADEKSREHMWKEALCASRLNDPNIAAIYDAFEDQNEVFLVMEYVQGQNLRQCMRLPLPLREFLPIAMQCASALAAAHRGGIQHRDIKPENILLAREGQIKILDFGIARRLPNDPEGTTIDTLTGEGLMGTVVYMAPEILEQRPSDDRADIFSLGLVFYEALAGKHPFRSGTLLETSRRIVEEEPPPPSKFNSDIPPHLDSIILRMLAKRPADRYAKAADVLADLEQVQKELDPERRALTPITTRRAGLLRTRNLLGLAVIAALAFAGWLAFRHFQKPVLNEHAPILIADFENRTAQPVFDQTVTEAVRESLEQSHYFRVIPRSQIHEEAQQTGRANITRVDRSLGRELCLRSNCCAVLAGAIVGVGAKYQITEELIDPAHDSPVLVETASMDSPGDLYTTVDSLAKKLRKGAGESLAQITHNSQPLAQVTTTSLEALQRYSRGLDLYTAGDTAGFIPLGESAVALDPHFAMAHLYLARAYSALGNEKEALVQLDDAKQNLNHVTERERYLILAEDYETREEYEKAADQFRLLTEVYPDDIRGFTGLARMSIWTGHIEDTVPAEQHALELAPLSAVGHLNLILDLDRLNRFDEALTAYKAARAAGLRSPLLRWGSGLAYLGKGDAASATREFQLMGNEGGNDGENYASFYLARVLMYQGHLQAAANELRRGLVLDEKMHSEAFMPVRHYLLAQIALIRGDKAGARTEAEQMAREALLAPPSEGLRRAGEMLVRVNEIQPAQKVLRALAKLSREHPSGFMQSCYYNLNGILQLAQNQTDASIESERKASVFFPLFSTYLGLGDAFAAKRDWSDAAQAYEKYLNFKGEILEDDSSSSWVLGHLNLARALAQAGKLDQARKYYDQFLQLWTDADSDLAILRQAREERAQLSKTQHSARGQAPVTTRGS
jgi:eukaryotic-like serine/threonine-protein kinase